MEYPEGPLSAKNGFCFLDQVSSLVLIILNGLLNWSATLDFDGEGLTKRTLKKHFVGWLDGIYHHNNDGHLEVGQTGFIITITMGTQRLVRWDLSP